MAPVTGPQHIPSPGVKRHIPTRRHTPLSPLGLLAGYVINSLLLRAQLKAFLWEILLGLSGPRSLIH